MKNNKIAIGVWLTFNFVLLELLLLVLRELSSGGIVLYVTSVAIYTYAFSFFWYVLRTHIKDANEIRGVVESDGNAFFKKMDSITNNMLDMAPFWLWMLPFYYWIVRVVLMLFGWLKTGEWSTFTTCDAIPSFCYFESNALGINKIVSWFANNDFGVLLLLVCGGLAWLTSFVTTERPNM